MEIQSKYREYKNRYDSRKFHNEISVGTMIESLVESENKHTQSYLINRSNVGAGINKLTSFLQKKKDNNMDLIFPVVFNHHSKTKFQNNSEMRRFTSTMELFLKLKYLIERDFQNKLEYIREVIKNF